MRSYAFIFCFHCLDSYAFCFYLMISSFFISCFLSQDELLCTYAALVLHDDGAEITPAAMTSLIKAPLSNHITVSEKSGEVENIGELDAIVDQLIDTPYALAYAFSC